MSRRLENWPALLDAFIEARRERSFAWGTQDCCMFAADAVREITGLDPAAEFRGRYDSALGAIRLLWDRGGVEGVVVAAAKAHGFAEISPAFARRGDLVLGDFGHDVAAGICLGAHVAFPGPNGLTPVPLSLTHRAFRVE